MRKALGMTLAIALVATSIACSSRGTGAADEANAGRIRELEQSFVGDLAVEEKIRIAVELVRLRAASPDYRVFLLQEAGHALDAERKAAEEWMQQAGVTQPQQPKPHTQISYRRDQLVANNLGGRVDSEKLRRLLPGREPDAKHLVAIVGVSMTATLSDHQAIERLREALRGINVLQSAEAALGLARIKHKPSIPDIADAGIRFNDALQFANALTYFGDKTADDAAKRLLKNDALFEEMRETAELQKHDPYP